MISKSEIARKSVHLLGLLYIPGLLVLGKNPMFLVVLTLTALGAVVEFIRRKYVVIPEEILRDYEKKDLGAFMYTGIAFSAITPLFPTSACLIAASCAFAGDGVAGIFKRIKKELALPSYFFSSLLVAHLVNLPPIPSLVAIATSYLFEGKKLLNDNLTIPFSSAVVYYLLEKLLLFN